jgi:hypothetical protein
LVILATQHMGEAWFSQWQGIWVSWPWWAMFGVLLLGDDLTQYLWHRALHSPLLWPLHRDSSCALLLAVGRTFVQNSCLASCDVGVGAHHFNTGYTLGAHSKRADSALRFKGTIYYDETKH